MKQWCEMKHVHLLWDTFGVNNFLEHMDHVKELAMNVTNDDHGLLNAEHVGLIAYEESKLVDQKRYC